jgi:DNA-binding transcriptional LysR family regulator
VVPSQTWTPFRLNQVRYFVTVAQERQISRAADKLDVPQSTLSKAISQLEANLGVDLLERHPLGVTLTPAGNAFLAKAQVAVAAHDDAGQTADMLARGQNKEIEMGFVVAAPGLHSPGPLKALGRAHPEITLHYREMPFPFTPTRSWLSSVDVAACHLPPPDPKVWVRPFGREPRVVLAAKGHRLAGCEALHVADVLDETFISFDPSTDPEWAGFWSLDDHRGAPPRRVTADRVANGQEVLASISLGNSITTAPAVVGALLAGLQTGVVTIPLEDAEPSEVVLVGRNDRRSPPVEAMLALFRSLDDRVQADLARETPREHRESRDVIKAAGLEE